VRRRGLLALGAAATAALAVAAACSDRIDHVFGGYAYNSAGNCLYTSGAVDVIAGPDPGTCPMVRCWVSPSGLVYVTDQACDAPPDYQDDTSADAGPCVNALADYYGDAGDAGDAGPGLCPAPPDGGAAGAN
jgi:hypothetical protein